MIFKQEKLACKVKFNKLDVGDIFIENINSTIVIMKVGSVRSPVSDISLNALRLCDGHHMQIHDERFVYKVECGDITFKMSE